MKDLKIVKPITEDEMIAVFLKAEIVSKRFGKRVLDAVKDESVSRIIIDKPDLEDNQENRKRRKVLAAARCYGENKALFSGFPNDVKWYRAVITGEGLKKVKYIPEDYWVNISKGTRLPKVAVETIKSGEEIFRQKNNAFWEVAKTVKKGIRLPELILVGINVDSMLVVIEGHLRITGYVFDSEHTPQNLEVIIGLSEHMTEWWAYLDRIRKLRIDKAIYEVDDESKTYRFLRRNPNWQKLSLEENMLNKKSINGYTRVFRDGTTKKFHIE
ncbi:hypothetical protein C4544_07200 [candidate division WS5 bacterium]|uniref:Uncharacterized protein n=1 Tax=candidate division WS5 bacterium TaxID=2093353 RepID=A0A419DAI4_9BACT|nr:MAG: hypothetical protein C4544_07200 [candidate division WS5 bacterium]